MFSITEHEIFCSGTGCVCKFAQKGHLEDGGGITLTPAKQSVPSPAAFSGKIQVSQDKEFLTLLKSAALLLEKCSYQNFSVPSLFCYF